MVPHRAIPQISLHGADLKKSLKVIFEGEEGLDAGGLRKEVCKNFDYFLRRSLTCVRDK